jgi:hypothetical protein
MATDLIGPDIAVIARSLIGPKVYHFGAAEETIHSESTVGSVRRPFSTGEIPYPAWKSIGRLQVRAN